MTEAFTNFYSSDQLQKVDWKRTFQHMHALPYSRLVADLRSDTQYFSYFIRIYSTESYIGLYHMVRQKDDTLLYEWDDWAYDRRPNRMDPRSVAERFGEHSEKFTSQQLEDKLHGVASRENYRLDVTKSTTRLYRDMQAYSVHLQST